MTKLKMIPTMKLYVIIISLMFILPGNLIAQNDQELTPDDFKRHELGFNVTGFAKQFLSFNADLNLGQSPYMITYNYKYRPNSALRFGFGGFYNSTTADNDNVFIPRTNDDFNFNGRAGIQFDKSISKRWALHYGGDIIGMYSRSVVKTQSTSFGDTFVKSVLGQVGLGPLLGASFMLHPNVRLWSEANLYVFYRQLNETEIFEGTEFEFSNFLYEFDASIKMPVSLFLSMTF